MAAGRPVRSASGQTMGTTWMVRWHAHDGAVHPQLAIDAELARLGVQLSTWRDDSDITRLNDAPVGDWIEVPDTLFEVVASACAIALETGGAFDPTVGAIVESWGFGPQRGVPHVLACDWRAIELDVRARAIRRSADVRLDLSAIAKGDAVDRVSALMGQLGLSDHLVEIGGELRGAGVKPDWSPWWVALESPPDAAGRATRPNIVVALHGLSVATSGDYRQRVTRAGVAHSHTVDPRLGTPVAGDVAAVSVIHESCRMADAVSTALLVMGAKHGLEWATRHGIAAVFRCRRPDGPVDLVTPCLNAWSQPEPSISQAR
ncbi:FAD:protein FMN transferase [soil metagenome]